MIVTISKTIIVANLMHSHVYIEKITKNKNDNKIVNC